jgi:hypothetical protein
VTWFLTWLGGLLGGPFAKAAVDAYGKKLAAENSSEKTAADLAGRELAVEQREIELQTQYRIAELGYWYEPDKLMGYTVAVYFAKLLLWDKVLALGSTDALAGFAATTANLIVVCYFGKRGVETFARIWKR